MIKERAAGSLACGLCRKHGLSPATFDKLKAGYGAVNLSAGEWLKQFEDENAKRKRLLSDTTFGDVVPTDLSGRP